MNTFEAAADQNIKKLTSLDDDCLEFLFDYLDWSDLLNVADSSRMFHTAVGLVFKRKYHKSSIIIDGIACKSSPSQRRDNISISKPVTALKFLRNFGYLICDLQLNCRFFGTKITDEITRYMLEYCSKSIYSLSLYCNSSKFLFKNTGHIFGNVEKLRMELCIFGSDLRLNNIFPNLSILNLGQNWYEIGSRAIRINLHSVRDLTIQANKFEETDIKELIKLNPQLERLEIYPIYSVELIAWINDCLPKLRSLELGGLPQEFYGVLRLDHIVNLSLHIDVTPLRKIPFVFRKLENLLVVGSLRINEKCLDFFGNIQHLKVLTILGWYGDMHNMRKFFELNNILSNVEELNFDWIESISSECILRFLQQSHALSKLTINVNKAHENTTTINALKGKLDTEWKIREGLFSRQYIFERIIGTQNY